MTSALAALTSLFENKIFLSTALSLCVAQVLKFVIYLITNRNKKKRIALETVIWRTGGMPSSHSAVVCALVTSAASYEGMDSHFFIFCLVFATVVLRDSMGVRRAAGLQAKALNILGKQYSKLTGQEFTSVKEIQGHTPPEVLVGAFLGILIAVFFYLI